VGEAGIQPDARHQEADAVGCHSRKFAVADSIARLGDPPHSGILGHARHPEDPEELCSKVVYDGKSRRRRILDGSSGIINLLQGVNTP
jgi:hypothetical protein